MSNLYNELENNKKIAVENIQNECSKLCLKIENNIKQRALNGFENYKYTFNKELEYERFSCGIVEYFKNKGVYCKRYHCINHDEYDNSYDTYYIDFEWNKTLEEYEKCEKIENIFYGVVLLGIIYMIVCLLF